MFHKQWSTVVAFTIGMMLMVSHCAQAHSERSSLTNAENTSESSNTSNKLDVTVYLRMEALLKNQLFIDPGQREAIDYIDISVGIDAYYGRYFMESSNKPGQGNQSASIGYRLIEESDYQVDVLFAQTYLDGLSSVQGNLLRSEPSDELKGIRDRDDELNQGVRYTKYNDNQAWWIDVASDVFNYSHGGWVVDSYIAQAFQIYNWEVHAGLGATFFSKEVVNHHAGVTADESTPSRPIYEAGFGTRYSLDLSAQYPLSKNWVFVSGLSYKHYSSSFADSPLYKTNQQKLFRLGVMYVW